MRKWLIAGLCLAAALLTTAFATHRVLGRRRRGETPPRILVAARGDVLVRVRETGTVEPFTRVEVKSKVGGRILRVTVEEGQPVRAGQLLAEIDRSETQSQVNQIQAQIAAARARLLQSETELRYQVTATRLAQEDAEQALSTSQARLSQAQRQARAQPTLTRSAIAQAEANHRAAEASLAALRDSTQPQTVADARAAYDQAQANADTASKHLHRQRALLERGFVPENQVDDAQRDYDNACSQRDAAKQRMNTLQERLGAELREADARVAETRASLDAARANAMQDALRMDELSAARAAREQARVGRLRAAAAVGELDSRRAEVAAARAGIRQLEDQFAEISVRLQDATILAPMSGTVTKRYIEAGELVTSGIATFSSGMPIVQIADLTRMRVVCNINEVDVSRVRVGQRAEITLDAARGQQYPGEVVSVAPAAMVRTTGGESSGMGPSSSIVKFQVKIAVRRTDGQLKPGMSADVDIITAERRGVVTVPLEAVDLSAKPPRVTLLRGADHVPVNVETGLRNDTTVEIRSGLKPGDRVLPAAYHGVPRKGFKGLP